MDDEARLANEGDRAARELWTGLKRLRALVRLTRLRLARAAEPRSFAPPEEAPPPPEIDDRPH